MLQLVGSILHLSLGIGCSAKRIRAIDDCIWGNISGVFVCRLLYQGRAGSCDRAHISQLHIRRRGYTTTDRLSSGGKSSRPGRHGIWFGTRLRLRCSELQPLYGKAQKTEYLEYWCLEAYDTTSLTCSHLENILLSNHQAIISAIIARFNENCCLPQSPE